MELAQSKDQLAKVTIISDQNPVLTVSRREDLAVFQSGIVVGADSCDVMTERAKMGC
jgi:hypothetical protein